jgi:hypothetical protein
MNDRAAPHRLEAEWLAHRFDEARGEIRFVPYSRAERAAVPFLIDAHLPAREYKALSRDAARAERGEAPVHFVFHSGFCCSTLLAASLDQPGLASSFSEPTILNDAFGWRLRGAASGDLGILVDDALGLLARPFAGDAAAVLKPSTVVNGLAEAMLAIRPQARAIVMYAPLRDFLISIAKKGLDGRLWVRDLLVKCRAEGRTGALGFSDLDLLGQSDLQVAALDWLMQHAVFAQLISATPQRVRSLSSETFMSAPERTLEAAARLFQLPWNDDHLDAALTQTMRRNSKSGAQFGAADRAAEYERAYAVHADEIDKVLVWAGEVARSAGLPVELAAPLI